MGGDWRGWDRALLGGAWEGARWEGVRVQGAMEPLAFVGKIYSLASV